MASCPLQDRQLIQTQYVNPGLSGNFGSQRPACPPAEQLPHRALGTVGVGVGVVLPSSNSAASVPFFRAQFSHSLPAGKLLPAWPDVTAELSLSDLPQSHQDRQVLGTSPAPDPLFLSVPDQLAHLTQGTLLSFLSFCPLISGTEGVTLVLPTS